MPKELLTRNNNYERFLASQSLILNAVSKVCKYVQCSTVEVTVSHSFVLDVAPNESSSRKLAMSVTAARTNKESLAAISEVPVIIEQGKKIEWYGQLHKRPSSEYRQHWKYHNRKTTDRVTKNLVVHFHPVVLLDTFRKVHHRHEGSLMTESAFIRGVAQFFEEIGMEFYVFTNYELSSRSEDFGQFMRDRIKDTATEYSLIWKPNHGIWVFLDDRNCTDDNLVETCLTLDNICWRAAREVCPEAF
jgi:hypothetical protein